MLQVCDLNCKGSMWQGNWYRFEVTTHQKWAALFLLKFLLLTGVGGAIISEVFVLDIDPVVFDLDICRAVIGSSEPDMLFLAAVWVRRFRSFRLFCVNVPDRFSCLSDSLRKCIPEVTDQFYKLRCAMYM